MQNLIAPPTHRPLAAAQYSTYLQRTAPFSFCTRTFAHLSSRTFAYSSINNNIDNDEIMQEEEEDGDDVIITFYFLHFITVILTALYYLQPPWS